MKRMLIFMIFLFLLAGCSRYEKSKPINSINPTKSIDGNQSTTANPQQSTDGNLENIIDEIDNQNNVKKEAIGLDSPQNHLSKVLEGELGKITVEADVYIPEATLYHYTLDVHKYDIEKLKDIFFEGKTSSRNDDNAYKTYELTEDSVFYHLSTDKDGLGITYYCKLSNPVIDKEFYTKVSVESAAKECKEVLTKLEINTSEYYIYKKKEDMSGLPVYEFTFYSNRDNVRVTDKSYDMTKTSPLSTMGEFIKIQYSQHGVSWMGVGMYRDVTKTGEVYQLDKLITAEEAAIFLQEEIESWGFDYDETFHMISLVYAPTQEKGSTKIDGIYSVFWEFSPEPSSDHVDRYLVNAESGRVFK